MKYLKLLIVFNLLFGFEGYSQINEKLVEFSTHDNHTLRAKLSYPTDKPSKKYPAVLILHGSGPADMNFYLPETVTADQKPHKMFEVIAHKLNQSGLAVFRYNKRGVTDNPEGAPTIDSKYNTADFVNLLKDAKSALKTLKEDPNVDSSKIYLLGISEGTVLAPNIAKEDSDIAGLILLSSVGGNLRELLYFQLVEREINIFKNLIDANDDGYIEKIELDKFPSVPFNIEALDRNNDKKLSMPEIRSFLNSTYYSIARPKTPTPFSKWLKQHADLPPNFETIAKFKGPILFLQGEKDAQTPIDELFMCVDQLKASGHSEYTQKIFPNLGHLFSPNTGPNKLIPTFGPIDPKVLKEMTKWFEAQLN